MTFQLARRAQPRTGWLAGQLAEDSHGFLLTGTGIPAPALGDQAATPLFLETSRPGIFAVGDVRSGSVKHAAGLRPRPSIVGQNSRYQGYNGTQSPSP